MDSYIEDRRQEGKLDSQGTFTVDALGALRKTLASALPEPHYYLLLIAQGLIAGGATDIEVAIGRHATRFVFRDPQKTFVDLQAAQERLRRGLTLSSARPWDLMLSGMATAIGSEMDRADLTPGNSQQSLQISYESAAVVDKPPLGVPELRSVLHMHRTVSMGLSFGWTRIWGARTEEEDLQRRFEFAWPSLKVAGLPTSAGSGWRRNVHSSALPSRWILLEAAVFDPAAPGHAGPVFAEVAREGVLKGGIRCAHRRAYTTSGEAMDETMLGPDDWSPRRWTFCVGTMFSEAPATVWWIRNGMTVERTTLTMDWPGLLVVAPADDLDVDASGFAIVRNEKFEARQREAVALAGKTIGGCKKRDLLDILKVQPAHGLSAEELGALESGLSWPD